MGWGRGGRLFEAGRLLTFSTFRMAAYNYSRWALIRGWALIRINTVCIILGGKGGAFVVYVKIANTLAPSQGLRPASILKKLALVTQGNLVKTKA